MCDQLKPALRSLAPLESFYYIGTIMVRSGQLNRLRQFSSGQLRSAPVQLRSAPIQCQKRCTLDSVELMGLQLRDCIASVLSVPALL